MICPGRADLVFKFRAVIAFSTAGSPYKADGLMDRYSQYGSPCRNKSGTNPYATQAPAIVGADGSYNTIVYDTRRGGADQEWPPRVEVSGIPNLALALRIYQRREITIVRP
jgi:hypothetical protein